MVNPDGRPKQDPEQNRPKIFASIRLNRHEEQTVRQAFELDRQEGELLSVWCRRKLLELAERVIGKK